MAIDGKNHRLFSGCSSGVMAVSDYDSGKVVATVPIGGYVNSVAFDPSFGDAIASNGHGLIVIHQDGANNYRVVGTMPTSLIPLSMGLDPTSHRLFVTATRIGVLTDPQSIPFQIMVIERGRQTLPPLAFSRIVHPD
jgi:hypothetical protein